MDERLDTREQQMTTKLPELPWIASARQHIGVREAPGPKNSTVIAGWLAKLKAYKTPPMTMRLSTSEGRLTKKVLPAASKSQPISR